MAMASAYAEGYDPACAGMYTSATFLAESREVVRVGALHGNDAVVDGDDVLRMRANAIAFRSNSGARVDLHVCWPSLREARLSLLVLEHERGAGVDYECSRRCRYVIRQELLFVANEDSAGDVGIGLGVAGGVGLGGARVSVVDGVYLGLPSHHLGFSGVGKIASVGFGFGVETRVVESALWHVSNIDARAQATELKRSARAIVARVTGI